MNTDVKLLLLLAAVCLLASCRCKQQAVVFPQEPVVLHQKDSVRVEYVERVTIDTVTVEIPVPMQSASVVARDSVSFLETDFAESWARVLSDGSLSHTLRNKEGVMRAETYVPSRETERAETVYVDREVPVNVPYPVEVEKRLTKWQEFRMGAFWYLVGALALSLLWIFRKKLLSWVVRI